MTQPTQSDSLADSYVLQVLKRRIYHGKSHSNKLSDLRLASEEILNWVDKTIENTVKALYTPKPAETVEPDNGDKLGLVLRLLYTKAYTNGFNDVSMDSNRGKDEPVAKAYSSIAAHYAAKEQEAYIAGVNADKRSVQEAVLRARIDEATPNASDDGKVVNIKVSQKNHINSTDYEKGWNDCWDAFWTEHWQRVSDLTNQLNQMNGDS